MSRHALKSLFALLALSVAMLAGPSGAQALVVDPNAIGQAKVLYDQSKLSDYVGVALAPGMQAKLATAKIPTVTTPSCPDPWLSSDLVQSQTNLCWHNGGADPANAVMHSNETFALTWDPSRSDWAGTRHYVEQFLRDVADGSGAFTSPFAVTTQYRDQGGTAGNSSLYGGGCIDYGPVTLGASCVFNNAVVNRAGHAYPPSSSVCGAAASACLTDAAIQAQLQQTIATMGLSGRIQSGHTPILVLLTPPGVVTCLDKVGTLCSANGTSSVQFCSYHSSLVSPIDQRKYAYIVQPWTAGTSCDDPGVPALAANTGPTPADVGQRLVSPLSAAQIAAITNPWMSGWFAGDGSEITDSQRCAPSKQDAATVGNSGQNPYFLQPAFSNAGSLVSDPDVPACAHRIALAPAFVVPSPIDQGDVVAFDGSVTLSSLIVPNGNYSWNFGDGSTAVGPSVVHAYAKGGTYTVTLTVKDRGDNVRSVSQNINVLGPDGQPVSNAPAPAITILHARLALLPQSLSAILRGGIGASLTANEPAAGIASLVISRRDAARAHIRHGRGATVVVARGTISQIRNGTIRLNLHLSRSVAQKLARLRHLTVTVRLSLVDAARHRLTVVAAGRY